MNKNQVKIFENNQFGQIRTAGTSEEPLFCLKDVCRVLELQVTPTKNRLKTPGVTSIKVGVQTGVKSDGSPATQQINMIFINEQNLYKVIMRSDKPQAEAFQDWVCGEVLPSIRKNGGYIATNEEDDAEMILAKALKVADATIKRKEQQLLEQKKQIDKQIKTINKMKPLAEYCSEVLQSDSTYTLTQVSKDLGFKSVYKFLDWANKNILYKQSNQWMPTAEYSGKDYFKTRTTKYFKSDGTIGTKMSTVVTEKGREFLHNIISNNNK